MSQAVETESTMIVNRVRGQNYSTTMLKQWTVEICGHILDQLSTILTMMRGWFALIFTNLDQENWVLSKYWKIEMTPVLLKRWSPRFAPNK